ncbi:YopX family protein [Bacillus pumilus]|uniref:YopX family protein n=1 Tax=Bacillus pumilus TaxID=1408 RepID=UPI00227F4365|nr:YopX family protein [Bacillus pumilus]MCY7572329.1 YopX family protein [Bacillus pumilus]MEC3762012.1 YopX family protein [Bacillus pumilus]
MREIKFRAWDDNAQEMVYEVGLTPEGIPYSIPDHAEASDQFDYYPSCHKMQFTGLRDKNDVEIYEGDILKRTVTIVIYGTGKPPEDIDEYLEVQYREDYAGFFIGERSLFAYVDTTIDVDTRCSCTKAEVVGNIYQNPNLLKEEAR